MSAPSWIAPSSLAFALDLRRIAEAVDHQLRALGRERLRDREPDARRRAGDKRDFAFENHRCPPSRALACGPSSRIATGARHRALGSETGGRRCGWAANRESSNFEDRTGRGGMGFGGGGFGGGARMPPAADRQPLRHRRRHRPRHRLFPAELARRARRRRRRSAPGTGPQRGAPCRAKHARSRKPSEFLLQRPGLDRGDLGPDLQPNGEPLSRRPSWSLIRSGDQSGCGSGAGGDGAVLLPDRQQHLSRHRILQRAVAAFRRARRFRAGLCDRARGRPSRPGPRGHARPGAQPAGPCERDRRQCDPGQGRAAGRLLCRRLGREREGRERHR